MSALVAGAFVSHAAYALETNELRNMSLEALGSIEVTTVSKVPESLWKVPAAIYVLTGDDIRRSGIRSLADALRLVPGVEVAQIDSGHWSVGVRGFGDQFSKSVLVLIDGRSVYTPLFAGVFGQPRHVLEDIDRIGSFAAPVEPSGVQRGQRRDRHHHEGCERHRQRSPRRRGQCRDACATVRRSAPIAERSAYRVPASTRTTGQACMGRRSD